MNWKSQPSWLKGGILALTIGLSLVLLGVLLTVLGVSLDSKNIVGEGVIRSGVITIIGKTIVELATWPFRVLDYVILKASVFVLQFFVIGALIGLVLGKIKHKKR